VRMGLNSGSEPCKSRIYNPRADIPPDDLLRLETPKPGGSVAELCAMNAQGLPQLFGFP